MNLHDLLGYIQEVMEENNIEDVEELKDFHIDVNGWRAWGAKLSIEEKRLILSTYGSIEGGCNA